MAVVFIHGSGGTSETWSHQIGAFPGAIALDLPGHLAGTGLISVRAYAEWVRQEVHRQRLSRPILVGHSLGGAIVQTYALEFPGELRGIVLVGTGARLRVLPALLDGIRANYPEAVRTIIDLAYAAGASPRARETAVAAMQRVPPEVTWGDFYACDQFDVTARLPEIDLPTLVVCGTEDRLTPVKYARYLAEHIAGARLVLIEGAGHMVMAERPEELNTALAAFVGDLEGK